MKDKAKELKTEAYAYTRHLKDKAISVPCSSMFSDEDSRMASMAKIRQKINAAPAPKQLNLWADYGVAVSNVWIRFLQDMNAVFNIYFANNPNWEGTCDLLTPKFENFAEVGSSSASMEPVQNAGGQQEFSDFVEVGATLERHKTKRKHRRRAQSRGGDFDFSKRPPSPPNPPGESYDRSAPPDLRSEKTVVSKGRVVSDAENPFCQYSWANSESILQQDRAASNAYDLPTNRLDDAWTKSLKGEKADAASSTMYPHLLCFAASIRARWNTVTANKKRSKKDKIPFDGVLVFPTACQQSRVKVDMTKKTMQAHVQQLPCEHVTFSAFFRGIFPKAWKGLYDTFLLIQRELHKILRCAGRINEQDSAVLAQCTGTFEHHRILNCKDGDAECQKQYEPVLNFVKEHALTVHRLVVETMSRLAVGGISRKWFAKSFGDDVQVRTRRPLVLHNMPLA